MPQKLSSGLSTYNWATDSTQAFVNGMAASTDGTNPSNVEIIDKFMQEKVTLNGVKSSKSNFDFIKTLKGDAVKNLTVTDASSNKTTLLFSSDTSHVEGRGGVLQDQINADFYKMYCKEFTSVDGSDITVPNGWRGYVNTFLINGKTQVFKRAKGTQNAWVVTPDNETRDTVNFEYKLDSTKASITCNGIKYNFYMPDGSAIDLGGVSGVGNTFECKEDGSGVATQNTKQIVLNGSESCGINDNSLSNVIGFYILISDKAMSKPIVCDKINFGDYKQDIECISGTSVNNAIVINIARSKLATPDVVGFKTWLQANPVTVRYHLATPIVTTIPKEKMPCVLTQFGQNIISLSDAVKAASCVLTMPTNDMLKKDYVITLLNNYTQVAGSFNPRLSLRNDNKVELSLDLMSSATYNPTIIMLPVELRPKTDIKLSGFVDNISTPIIIKKTGEVQVPNSIVSKNVYVKDTYRLV